MSPLLLPIMNNFKYINNDKDMVLVESIILALVISLSMKN